MILPERRAVAVLAAAFVLSGACGLMYESVWAHYLKLFVGHAAYAQTVVLVVFVGGMAIGAALCGRLAERIANPLRAYALVELAIGLGGVTFHQVFVRAIDWGYATLLPLACDPTGACHASWLLAAALVLPQSVALGTTFPLMVSGVMRATGGAAGRQVSLLYFLNSIGAVAGVLASTFVLIPAVGLPGTTLTAGVVNVAIAIVVWEVGGRTRRQMRPAEARAFVETDRASPSGVRLLLAVSMLTGLSSFMYEIFWIRMLSLVLGASTHAFELMLASFILGLALGGWWIRSRIDGIADAWRFLGRVQLLMGLAAVATLPLYNHTFDLMASILGSLARTEGGYALYNVFSAGIAMAVMLPATFLAGMTLPLITLLLIRTRLGERSIGFVYAANTAGAIAGVLLAVHLLMPWVGLRAGMLIAGGIDIVLGIVLFAHARRSGSLSALDRFAATIAVAGTAFVAVGTTLDPYRLASGVFRGGAARLGAEYEFLFHRDGKTATVDVFSGKDGVVFIRTNGKTDATVDVGGHRGSGRISTSDEDTMTLLGALPIAFRPDAEEIAVIGFGSGMSTSTLLGSPRIRRVETIEIEPAMIEGARAFRPLVDPAYIDPRSHLIIDDAKAHFARSGRSYDVILSEPSNPWVSGVSSLFTEEFYRRMSLQLRDNGILVQWVHVYEFDSRLLAAILKPLGDVFADYVVYRSGTDDAIIVATPRGSVGEASARLFGDPQLAARLARIGITSLADIETRRAAGRNPIDQYIADIPIAGNSDYFPVVDLNAARARFMGRSASEVIALIDGPMPLVEMLERRPLRLDAPVSAPPMGSGRQQRTATAEKWAAYLQTAQSGDGKPGGSGTALEESVSIARAIFIECAPIEVTSPLWDRMILVAAEITPVLPSDRAEELWRTLGATRCSSRLPTDKRSWIDLFAAVGARDASGMSRLAEQLLASGDTSMTQREYLYNAAITGYLADRRYGDARAALERAAKVLGTDRMRTPWMQLQTKWAQTPF